MVEERRVIWGFYPGTHEVEGDFSEDLFSDKQVLGVGWPQTGNLQIMAQECRPVTEFLVLVRAAYRNNADVLRWKPDVREKWFRRGAGVLRRFLCEAMPGDLVIYANKRNRQVYVGRISDGDHGRYRYDDSEGSRFHRHFRHFRGVEWLSRVPYDKCTNAELRQARTQNTFWRMKSCPASFLAAL